MTGINVQINSKRYRSDHPDQEIISDFNLSLTANEFTCLVGPSGCGKTTLLNIIAELDSDFTGQISLGNQNYSPKIGYVFQNPRLLPWRTVRENISLSLRSDHAPEIVTNLLEVMNLTDVQDYYPEKLSLGMSRRVAIIRAFAVDPDILLMDEPFVSLDAPTARQIRNWLLELWQKRPHTILFVTHDLREAIALADRLIFLSHKPMRRVKEIIVPIPRKQREDSKQIEDFRQMLLDDYPEIRALL